MRLFAAVRPPQHVLDALGEFLAPRVEADSTWRWTDPDQWHVTLAFMESVPVGVDLDVLEAVESTVRSLAPVRLTLRAGGAFPDVPSARVLYAAVSPSAALDQLARRVRSAVARAGARPQGGRFTPHLTLARTGRPVEATRWLRVLDGLPPQQWLADEVTLIESHLGQGRGGRPRYAVLGTAALASP